MSNKWLQNIKHVSPGEPVKAGVVARPDRVLADRTEYLRQRLDAAALGRAIFDGAPIDPATVTYVLGRETAIVSAHPGMALWREHLFDLQNRSAASAARFFRLPSSRVFEVGSHVDI